MPHQQLIADVGLESIDGRRAYRDVDVALSRQQGKSTLMFSVAMLTMLPEGPPRFVTYTPQSRLDGRKKMIHQWWPAIQASPLKGRFRFVRQWGAEEFIYLPNESSFILLSSDEATGHGDVIDLALLDECWALDSDAEQAVRPALMTRANGQIWRFSTAGKRKSVYWRQRVDDGRAAVQNGLTRHRAYFEWSSLPEWDPSSPETWRKVLLALGHTIDEETVASDFDNWSLKDFRRAYLNMWPDETDEGWGVIPEDLWTEAEL